MKTQQKYHPAAVTMRPGYLEQRMKEYRKKVAEEFKRAEEELRRQNLTQMGAWND